MFDVVQHYQSLITELASLGKSYGLQGTTLKPPALCAVTKTIPVEQIEPLLQAGCRLFGENRVQEAAAKYPALRATYPDLQLHLIGPLQSNKVADALKLFDVIETLDRPKLAATLHSHWLQEGRRVHSLYIQVNTGNEPQKSGVSLSEFPALLAYAREELQLPVVGVMCVPPVDDDAALHFALLQRLAQQYQLSSCSMGMSNDYRLAAMLGSTEVRIGSRLFGARS
jgi:PLP dependent protein